MPTEYKDCQINEFVDRFEGYIKDTVRPSVTGVAVREFMDRSTIYEWAKRRTKDGDLRWPRIKQLMGICLTKQRHALIDGGLENEINPAIAALCLKSNHGFTDRIEQQGNPDRPLQTETRELDMSRYSTEELEAARAFIEKGRSS